MNERDKNLILGMLQNIKHLTFSDPNAQIPNEIMLTPVPIIISHSMRGINDLADQVIEILKSGDEKKSVSELIV